MKIELHTIEESDRYIILWKDDNDHVHSINYMQGVCDEGYKHLVDGGYLNDEKDDKLYYYINNRTEDPTWSNIDRVDALIWEYVNIEEERAEKKLKETVYGDIMTFIAILVNDKEVYTADMLRLVEKKIQEIRSTDF